MSQSLDWGWRALWSFKGLNFDEERAETPENELEVWCFSIWLLPEQLPLPFPQSDGSAVDVHINMEQAPIQVSWGLGGSGKGIWEKEAMRLDWTWLMRC